MLAKPQQRIDSFDNLCDTGVEGSFTNIPHLLAPSECIDTHSLETALSDVPNVQIHMLQSTGYDVQALSRVVQVALSAQEMNKSVEIYLDKRLEDLVGRMMAASGAPIDLLGSINLRGLDKNDLVTSHTSVEAVRTKGDNDTLILFAQDMRQVVVDTQSGKKQWVPTSECEVPQLQAVTDFFPKDSAGNPAPLRTVDFSSSDYGDVPDRENFWENVKLQAVRSAQGFVPGDVTQRDFKVVPMFYSGKPGKTDSNAGYIPESVSLDDAVQVAQTVFRVSAHSSGPVVVPVIVYAQWGNGQMLQNNATLVKQRYAKTDASEKSSGYSPTVVVPGGKENINMWNADFTGMLHWMGVLSNHGALYLGQQNTTSHQAIEAGVPIVGAQRIQYGMPDIGSGSSKGAGYFTTTIPLEGLGDVFPVFKTYPFPGTGGFNMSAEGQQNYLAALVLKHASNPEIPVISVAGMTSRNTVQDNKMAQQHTIL